VPLAATNQSKNQEASQEMQKINRVIWNPNGSGFAALDKASLVFVFP